jgi:hypothetical protein
MSNSGSMKLMKLIRDFFSKRKNKPSPISVAISEAFRESFKEMEYPFKNNSN